CQAISRAELDALEDALLNTSNKFALHDRFRTLFALKSLKNDDAVAIISKGVDRSRHYQAHHNLTLSSTAFDDPSALLKHELAYCLGQMKNSSALPVLESVLRKEDEDPMVRHEVSHSASYFPAKVLSDNRVGQAAEAMGAISSTMSVPILREYLSDPNRSVRETCEIALAKIDWDNSEEGRKHLAAATESPDTVLTYTSIDPAPPSSHLLSGKPKPNDVTEASILSLREKLLNTELPLFARYRAMFALRNIGTPPAVDALACGFSDDSALFKHEIAFVFGQLLSAHSVPSLIKVLRDVNECDMVRHEAAEALGGIATPEVLPHLKEWMTREDSPTVVRESCQVAVDMWEVGDLFLTCNAVLTARSQYENSGEFQYANTLETVRTTEPVAA
ncbi:Deoxyhypusine hydroxylase, partial [Butyriboletus roseoflavus]